MKKSLYKKTVVLYHADCRDGFGAAWAAWKKFGNRAVYLPVVHGMPPPQGLVAKEIYTLDFTYPREITEQLMHENGRVTAIDHHVSSEKVAKMTEQYLYDVNHSGAVLSWKYFHPEEKVPFLLRCIEDYDIWKWSIARSKEVLAYVDLFSNKFGEWNRLARDLEIPSKRQAYIYAGSIILHYYNRIVDDFVKKAERVKFGRYVVYAVNVPGQFRSDVGGILVKKLPHLAILWREEEGILKVSLRSNGSTDVSKIAKRFGGGGHKAAAAFYMPLKASFPWKTIKK